MWLTTYYNIIMHLIVNDNIKCLPHKKKKKIILIASQSNFTTEDRYFT